MTATWLVLHMISTLYLAGGEATYDSMLPFQAETYWVTWVSWLLDAGSGYYPRPGLAWSYLGQGKIIFHNFQGALLFAWPLSAYLFSKGVLEALSSK